MGKGETLEAVELALHKIGDFLMTLSGCPAEGIVRWLFVEVLEKVTEERDTLHSKLDELGDELLDAL